MNNFHFSTHSPPLAERTLEFVDHQAQAGSEHFMPKNNNNISLRLSVASISAYLNVLKWLEKKKMDISRFSCELGQHLISMGKFLNAISKKMVRSSECGPLFQWYYWILLQSQSTDKERRCEGARGIGDELRVELLRTSCNGGGRNQRYSVTTENAFKYLSFIFSKENFNM